MPMSAIKRNILLRNLPLKVRVTIPSIVIHFAKIRMMDYATARTKALKIGQQKGAATW
jgi:hypothetical protein